MKAKTYIVTGANGHLGKTIIKDLVLTNCEVRGLVLRGEAYERIAGVKYYEGNVLELESLKTLFDTDTDVYVIHTAAIVDISNNISPQVRAVNVEGTKNILKLCHEYKIKRLLYVSSVHAIPEQEAFTEIRETKNFSSEHVIGGYAKTKAEASKLVLESQRLGLDVVIVHPSGIIGPNDDENNNHLVQMIHDYIHGNLPALVNGGYDFVDVRDVARGCILAIEKGKCGECYILSNHYYTIPDLLGMASKTKNTKKLPVLPIQLLSFIAPVFELVAKASKKRPLFTSYSLHTLKAKYFFSHEKASSEIGFQPRDLRETMRDTSSWILRNSDTSIPLCD